MDIEETLRRAAGQLSASLAEDGIPEVPRTSRRGWRVVALGAVVTFGVVGGLALLTRNGSPSPIGIDPESTTTFTSPTTSTTELPPTGDDVRFVSEEHGFEITYPAGWYRADEVLAPALTSPPQDIEEVLSLGTYPLRTGGSECPHVPLNAILDLGPEDALVSIVFGAGTGDPWPSAFSPDVFVPRSTASDAPVDARTCSGRSELDYHWGVYSLDGHNVRVFVAFGEGVDAETTAETWRILDSFVSTTSTSSGILGELTVPECEGTAGCIAGFSLDDVFYSRSCVAVRETAVTDQVIGTGRISDQQVTVNVVKGIDPGVLVAASIPGGRCSENDPDERHTDWSMAFPDGADRAQLQAAICDVGDLSAAQRLANGCHRDGKLVSCGSGPRFPPGVLDDLSLFPQPSESFGADVEALLGSDDSRQLVGWHVIVEDEKADGRYVQLLLREDPDTGELQYLLDGSDETFDTPRRCSPETNS